MEKFKLVYPTIEYEAKAFDYIKEFKEYNSQINGVGGLDRYSNYNDWLVKIDNDSNDSRKEPPRVQATTFFFVREEDDTIIGMINIRHYLNNYLLKEGGNIGYSIRPLERNKGYAKKMLLIALDFCKSLKIDRVLLTCDKNNIPSKKTIISCGGVFENEIYDGSYAEIVERYWIYLFKEVNNKKYEIIKLLGHGKSGYSYLAKYENNFVVLKQIHHEPCSYYSFSDKIKSEVNDYQHLISLNIKLPKMLEVDTKKECIIKEYIEGKTIFELVKEDKMESIYINKVKEMTKVLYQNNTNIDYFPTNFIVQESDKELFYIDYECNEYMEKWNFENWGIKYWSKTKEFMDYINKK